MVLAHMPNLSRHFHLTPADIWALTHRELNTYLDDLNQKAG